MFDGGKHHVDAISIGLLRIGTHQRAHDEELVASLAGILVQAKKKFCAILVDADAGILGETVARLFIQGRLSFSSPVPGAGGKVFGDHLSEIILNIQKSKNIQKAKTGKI